MAALCEGAEQGHQDGWAVGTVVAAVAVAVCVDDDGVCSGFGILGRCQFSKSSQATDLAADLAVCHFRGAVVASIR